MLGEFALQPEEFVMVGNSLRSDIEPVVKLGGWGIHLSYHVTWADELETGLSGQEQRIASVATPSAIPQALDQLAARTADG